jgi:hypothetical protein
MLSMLYLLHYLFLCCLITLELVGDDPLELRFANHPWHEPLFLKEFAKKTLRCIRISMSLQQDIQHGSC